MNVRTAAISTSLEDTVTAFRRGVERYVEDRPLEQLRHFPVGCCKTSATLLARYLAERGYGRANLVANARRQRGDATQTHAWLLIDGVTIDITADQFGPDHAPVIVGRPTPLHATFSGLTLHPYDSYMSFSASYQVEYDAMYAGIMAAVDASGRSPAD